jgi:ABC-type uncharacterized transport system permease subunit
MSASSTGERVAERPDETQEAPPPPPDDGSGRDEDGGEGSPSPLSRLRRLLLGPTLALVAALVVGGLLMVFTDPETLRLWASFFRAPGEALSQSAALVFGAYGALFTSSLGSLGAISETLVAATPLLFAGLAVAIPFRAGLFNIGAEGQLIAGSVTAVFVGFAFGGLPAVVHLPLALLAGFAGGAVWGLIPGMLKGWTGAHEVITTIMLNFIALFGLSYLLTTKVFQPAERTDPISKTVAPGAQLPSFAGYRVNLGFVLAVLVAIAITWLLFRTTIGFSLRSVGASPEAARYAGISVRWMYAFAMALGGAMAGLGGASLVLGVQGRLFDGSPGFGFEAIALALLARAHPIGVIAASILFGALAAGSTGMQAATSIPVDIILVIQSIILVFMAAPALVSAVFRLRTTPDAAPTVTSGWGA